MKLYFAKGACSLTVRIILHEVNLAAEFEEVDLKTKKTKSGRDFFEINPKGVVPVLELDQNTILTENSVILQYIADKHQQTTHLPPVNELKRYRVLEWLNYISTELHKSCGALFNPMFNQEVKNNVFIPLLKKKLDYVNTHLANKEFLLGDTFTLPDAYLFVILSWLKIFNIPLSDWENSHKYFNHLAKRPSIQKALKEEGFI